MNDDNPELNTLAEALDNLDRVLSQIKDALASMKLAVTNAAARFAELEKDIKPPIPAPTEEVSTQDQGNVWEGATIPDNQFTLAIAQMARDYNGFLRDEVRLTLDRYRIAKSEGVLSVPPKKRERFLEDLKTCAEFYNK